MDTKKILLGLAAAVAFGVVAGALISMAKLSVDPVVQSVFLSFLGTAIGAYIARRRFVLPALGLWFVEWLIIVYVLYFIAAPTGRASFFAITQVNLLSIVLSALAVTIGALLGQTLAKRTQRNVPAI